MPLRLIRQDITLLSVDAIVNAANEGLQAGGGVCGAIFRRAGHDELQRACNEIGHVDTGSAVATPGFALQARHIIHTAGPIWRGGTHDEELLLASCYRTSLELAQSLGDTSIAFPLISSGIYGYPPADALSVAIGTIRDFLVENPDFDVVLCLFDRKATTLTQTLFGEIEHFIDDTYVQSSPFMDKERRRKENIPYYHGDAVDGMPLSRPLADATPHSMPSGMPAPDAPVAYSAAPDSPAPKGGKKAKGPRLPWTARRERKRRKEEATFGAAPSAAPSAAQRPSGSGSFAEESALESLSVSEANRLKDMLDHLDAPFSQTLLAMIDERGLTDSQVYTRANLSRQYFSKLRSGSINPSKRVVLSLAVALELPLDQTILLLERAGHALTHASKFDIIVEWFIRSGRYDVFEINQALFAFDQQLLGAS